jgi:hypothetical protein
LPLGAFLALSLALTELSGSADGTSYRCWLRCIWSTGSLSRIAWLRDSSCDPLGQRSRSAVTVSVGAQAALASAASRGVARGRLVMHNGLSLRLDSGVRDRIGRAAGIALHDQLVFLSLNLLTVRAARVVGRISALEDRS